MRKCVGVFVYLTKSGESGKDCNGAVVQTDNYEGAEPVTAL